MSILNCRVGEHHNTRHCCCCGGQATTANQELVGQQLQVTHHRQTYGASRDNPHRRSNRTCPKRNLNTTTAAAVHDFIYASKPPRRPCSAQQTYFLLSSRPAIVSMLQQCASSIPGNADLQRHATTPAEHAQLSTGHRCGITTGRKPYSSLCCYMISPGCNGRPDAYHQSAG